jgi:alanyl-tRNA synthetase
MSLLKNISHHTTQSEAKKFIQKKYHSTNTEQVKTGDELMGVTQISAQDAFVLYTTHGLSPTQIKSLGYEFDDQDFANLMEEHASKSRAGAAQKFQGGLADQEELTIKGHTATHLMHQALRDVLGDKVHQSGSNITTERVRFDFNFDRKLTDEEIKKVENIVNEKIKENLSVHFEFMPIDQARKLKAIGLFDEKYAENVKIYFIGDGSKDSRGTAYSIEFCGGPHVDSTGAIKSFKIIKEEGLGKGFRRVYAKVS